MRELTNCLTDRLETLLQEGLSARGDGLEGKIGSVGKELPEDLTEMLRGLARRQGEAAGDGDAGLVEFAFQCGQAHERLENLIENRLAANVAFLSADGISPPELEKSDLDAIARFVALRDRILKTVADYTLKFLLVSVVLLAIGVTLGLI